MQRNTEVGLFTKSSTIVQARVDAVATIEQGITLQELEKIYCCLHNNGLLPLSRDISRSITFLQLFSITIPAKLGVVCPVNPDKPCIVGKMQF